MDGLSNGSVLNLSRIDFATSWHIHGAITSSIWEGFIPSIAGIDELCPVTKSTSAP